MTGFKCRITSFLIFFLYLIIRVHSQSNTVLRYTEESCSDLVPRNVEVSNNLESDDSFFGYTSNKGIGKKKRKKRQNYYLDVPFKLVVNKMRYSRNSDIIVTLSGGEFEGLMLQSRLVAGGSGVGYGSIGLIGRFRYLQSPFTYQKCGDLPYAAVVDKGRPVKLENVSFVWSSPEQDSGDVRFVASVLRGINYWIIASTTLTFNPFPVSTYGCGSEIACFRVCPFEGYPCGAKDASLIFTYKVNYGTSPEIEFTIGGKLMDNNTYLGVAFGEDYDLIQADLTVCYISNGGVRLEHLLIEDLLLPPYLHNEVIELEDYDYDLQDNMLWCRYRRQISPSSGINARKNLYHFYFKGSLDYLNQRFTLPRRSEIYSSAYKRNFSAPINEIQNGSRTTKSNGVFMLLSVFIFTQSTTF